MNWHQNRNSVWNYHQIVIWLLMSTLNILITTNAVTTTSPTTTTFSYNNNNNNTNIITTATTNFPQNSTTPITTNQFQKSPELLLPALSITKPLKVVGSSQSSTTTTTSSSPISTESSIPQICTRGIQQHTTNNSPQNFENNYSSPSSGDNFIETIEGDAVVSILTKDPISALFVGHRINQANLINGDFVFGMRVININQISIPENILLQEVEYLQLCTEHPIGVFIDFDVYQLLERIINDLEYNIWPIPSTRHYIFPKVAHLLYQMPWNEKTASVEILAENLNVYNDFMDAARTEHLCLMHFRSSNNIYMFLGNKMMSKFQENNGTIFVVPTGRTDKSFIADLPGNSYVLMESEIELKLFDENSTLMTIDNPLYGKNILSSELLAIGGPLLDLVHWLNESLTQKCEQNSGIIYFETCYDFLNFISDWNIGNHNYKPIEILEKLKLTKISHLMTFEMFQKKIHITNFNQTIDENLVELKEIASQNFITNITTYFHYSTTNSWLNKTINEKQYKKFGEIFNCQYADGTNRKFPYLIDGESVMYWRLKPQTWVAAGLTASVLGIMISLAILIFICIRIYVGDVFEGNPISSIALLISLILLFISIIPFAIEYTMEQRNSQITFNDANIMNKLCAVRIFLITICYCLIFSLLLCRGLMLASIGSEGGFLSHINGYIQTVIYIFSAFIQIGLSTQLLIVMRITNEENISCHHIYNGKWLWLLLTYDLILLIFLIILTPFIYRSQRNYREGILMVIGSILCLLIWLTWIPICMFGNDEWRDAGLPLGMQATGWSLLIGILIPRSFLIVRGIERSDIAQTLPSLTSLAFAQNNQYPSEQSVYECVNPAMRYSASREDGLGEIGTNGRNNNNNNQSPSEMPTLPLRGAGPRRSSVFQNMRNNSASVARRSSYASSQSSMPPSPQKITRF